MRRKCIYFSQVRYVPVSNLGVLGDPAELSDGRGDKGLLSSRDEKLGGKRRGLFI